MGGQQIVETMESVVEWLSQSDATSSEEDEDMAKALEIVKKAAKKHAIGPDLERLAELVTEYRATGDCFEGCDIADDIVSIVEESLLQN